MKILDEEHRLLTRLAEATCLGGLSQVEIARRFGLCAGEGIHKGCPYRPRWGKGQVL